MGIIWLFFKEMLELITPWFPGLQKSGRIKRHSEVSQVNRDE
jgi:hypothetical protein